MAKKKGKKKAAPKKTTPTLEQLRAASDDLNKFMDDVNDGKYNNPIDLSKEDPGYFSKQIAGMVKEEMYKQDKESLTVDSVEVIKELGVDFDTLRDDPEMAGEENGRNGKDEKAPETPKAPAEKKEGKKVKKAVKVVKADGEKSRYGSKLESQAALLDDLIYEGRSRSQIIERLEDSFDMSSGKAGSRLQTHINYLRKKKNLSITKLKNGSYEVK